MTNRLDAHTIGKPHKVCQDYSITGNNCVIIADGCSSSPMSDIGARLLALHSRQALEHPLAADSMFPLPILNTGDNYGDAFGHRVIGASALSLKMLDLPETTLDATLVTARFDPDTQPENGGVIDVTMYGDGWIIWIERDGLMQADEVHYMHNAPGYLSYQLNPERTRRYLEACLAVDPQYGKAKSRTSYAVKNQMWVQGQSHVATPLDPSRLRLHVNRTRLLLIASDGIGSFVEKTSRQPLPVEQVLTALVDFQVVTGPFVQKRLTKMVRHFERAGYTHEDDISVAGIHLGD